MAWQFWIDRGGTFTDIVGLAPDGTLRTAKLLSDDADAAVTGIRQLLGVAAGAPIPAGLIHGVKLGTTVATNALLTRLGAAVLLLTNVGFADLLAIGDQARPDLFDLAASRVPMLAARVAEVAGRLDAEGGELEALDEAAARDVLARARADGIEAVAIALLHAWRFPRHEQRLAALAREAGFTQVSASHGVSPLQRLVPRAETAVVDAYLSPVLRRHVDRLEAALPGVRVLFMQSDGRLAAARGFGGARAVLSGPAGGVVGAARTGAAAGFARVIGFDMGGTSTDVALCDGGLQLRAEATIAGARLRLPMLAIDTIAAGGGSLLRFDGARLRVGPESAGAAPGPMAYRNGGPLTVTDANLCLGRVQAGYFPAIFGPSGGEALDVAAVRAAFADHAEAMAANGRRVSGQDVAEGYLRVAVAAMAGAVRGVALREGRDARDFALAAFGGAGGQVACLVADALGMGTVLIHPLAGLLSAYGMGLADHGILREQAVETPLTPAGLAAAEALAARLVVEADAELTAQGAERDGRAIHCHAVLRHAGAEAALDVRLAGLAVMTAAFHAAHLARFGFADPARALVLASVRVEVVVPGAAVISAAVPAGAGAAPVSIGEVELWANGSPHAAPVFDRATLADGACLAGPALLREAGATTVLDPGWRAEVAADGMLILRRAQKLAAAIPASEARADPVLLELFHHAFMAAATEAGAVLARTALSVNIKERLDFSCAVFDPAGALIANAPHVPVHLGAMGESVRAVLARRGARLRPGDAVALNNPFAGGTHLPDVTVVSPVFDAAGTLQAFVASRAHHADIGGATPGSTPPHSTRLAEEGVVIDDFLLASDGVLNAASFRALLASGPYPARNPDMNLADAAAQLAANRAAAHALTATAERHGWAVLRRYMDHVLDNGADHVRRLLPRLNAGHFATTLDDGAPLVVQTRLADGGLVIDFTGTGAQRPGNFNAPAAVTRAVVLYVLRCLIGEDIPLNDGCLRGVTLIIPPGSFLAPAPGAAVVAGNTEISQIVCNALLGAFGAAASSQATMNNLLFGDAEHQYYETICGGAGATPTCPGGSAVQTHMTNTRMTDPEVLEHRLPVQVVRFARRLGSGGLGRQPGGDGAIRHLRFLAPMQLALVASRRAVAPFGLDGGGAGQLGRQYLMRADGSRLELAGQARIRVAPGDEIVIETPGGGAFGAI